MSFDNGHPKSGGRKPGTPNKRTQSLVETLEQHGYSPIADLIELSQLAKAEYKKSATPADASNWVRIGVACATGILPYVYAKRKPLEGDLEVTESSVQSLSNEELLQKARKTIDEFNQ